MITWGDETDEAAYTLRRSLLDDLYPMHGGKLRADGTWLQQSVRIDAPFSVQLPVLAREAGQRYAPVLEDYSSEECMAFLDSPELWEGAIDDLLLLIDSRFDAPWDGVMYGFEGAPSTYQAQTTDWFSMLAEALQSEGMLALMGFPGRRGDTGPAYDGYYTFDYRALGPVMDRINYGIAGYWAPAPVTKGPYWWVKESLEYGLETCEIPASKVYAYLTGWCLWCPYLESRQNMGYDQAMEMIGDTPIEWVEENVNGLVRENCAVLEDGVMWLLDGDYLNARLSLIDRYGIDGLGIYHPAWIADSLWQAIADWKRPASKPTDRFYQSPNWCA